MLIHAVIPSYQTLGPLDADSFMPAVTSGDSYNPMIFGHLFERWLLVYDLA